MQRFHKIVIVGLAMVLWGMSVAAADTVRIVALGDSLTAGYGLAPGQSFAARLEAALKARGRDVSVSNAGVSGDTSAGGLSRLDWAVDDKTDLVVLELGANDALRGIDPDETRKALGQIISRLKERDIAVLLTGMQAPPNMGAAYEKKFNGLFADLAEKHDVPLYPFFLEGVAGDASLNLADGMHPTAEGIDVIVERILPYVEKLIPPES